VIDCHNALAQSLWASIRIHLVILMVLVWTVCAVELRLYGNALNGTIPTEIGLMTSLGEYVLVIDCHNALAQSLWAGAHSYPPCDSNGLFGLFVQISYLLMRMR
jgi:hypothetical protein